MGNSVSDYCILSAARLRRSARTSLASSRADSFTSRRTAVYSVRADRSHRTRRHSDRLGLWKDAADRKPQRSRKRDTPGIATHRKTLQQYPESLTGPTFNSPQKSRCRLAVIPFLPFELSIEDQFKSPVPDVGISDYVVDPPCEPLCEPCQGVVGVSGRHGRPKPLCAQTRAPHTGWRRF